MLINVMFLSFLEFIISLFLKKEKNLKLQIYSKYLSKDEYISYTSQVVEQEYEIDKNYLVKWLSNFNNTIRNDITVFFEYPYVDKYYRDSYYTYYSTKHHEINRNSIRLSFFINTIDEKYFRTQEYFKDLNDSFLGYLTIRPTKRSLIGRNLISPLLYKQTNFVTCLTSFSTLINGVKLSVDAFPHCSQDTETITCAETTLLNIMEYFGTKYPEYSPVLPSKIIKQLSTRANERQLPSSGLSMDDISFVLKEFGFSPKIYYHSIYNENNLFKTILDIYIESGIPIIGAIENDSISHAVILIGRESLFDCSSDFQRADSVNFGFSSFVNKYVLMDDNHIPYSIVDYNSIDILYNNEKAFKNCKLTSFVVPLYSKIYVDAELAMMFFNQIKLKLNFLDGHDNYFTRMFLASSRSYKSYIASLKQLNSTIKELIIETAMPKFVWIIEILDPESYANKQIKGVLIIDATERNLDINDHLLFFIFDDLLFTYDKIAKKFIFKELKLNIFPIFANNLKGKHNLWQNY